MKKIILLTESGADMPLALVKLHNIQVVPMHVIMGDKSYADGSIAVTEVYDYYQRTKKVPSTSATNPDEYQDVFKRIIEENPGCIIIHVGYSSKPSCSYQNSIIASEGMENVYHADALNVTGGLAAIVLKAVELIEKHPDMLPNDLVENIESYASKARVSFIPGDLVYLKAGGRVSNAAYLGGTLLQLKPLIEIVNGELVSNQKYRGKTGNIVEKYMKEYINKYHMDKEQIYLIYSLGLEESIKQRMEQIAKEEGFKQIIWIQAGCMISAHSGPGAIGIAAFESMSSK
ncbi:DegV family protein [Clostridium sp. CF012]|uniref:DegV family protein n=1 Tax=Clostridium sp. CF012 TaxID=2843319 RepID=UPI001C0D5731|nr:DegV family protein [Clostridium sp. CF012]MBU3146141.1 DegV family protein [Clostridium sp. CF012]